MKLAEALIERKSLKTKMDELKSRIYNNLQIQEGDQIIVDPKVLMKELERTITRFQEIVIKINQTNHSHVLANSLTIAQALIKRDMLRYRYCVMSNIVNKAIPQSDRYSAREIKYLPIVDINIIQKKADKSAQKARELDTKIQESNWLVELD